MSNKQEKLKRLANVARLYYIDDKKQSDIAKIIGVSRPLISRMLTEAKELGLVEIIIHDPDERNSMFIDKLRKIWNIQYAILLEDQDDDRLTNIVLAEGAFELIKQLDAKHLGIGWGHFIGQLVEWLEQYPEKNSQVTDIYPFLGNAGVPIRNYHSNENVRIMAETLGAIPHFLNLPALPESLEEKQLLCSTELYKQMELNWYNIDTAIVNIGNYPSTPDFASGARYGIKLQNEKACGRLLAYYFNEMGNIIDYSEDFAIQIPIEILKNCKNVIGVCSANTAAKALKGALNTGIFTHIVARTDLVKEIITS